jgi:prephenate dehydrogenase
VIETIAIAGVGLIGGSFGLALRAAGFTGRLLGVSSPGAIEAARARGAVDEGVSLEDAAARADVIYLAQPIARILETIEALGALARPGVLVTDAGSTKRAIVRKAKECLPEAVFLGGHPMAGKEARGVEAAEAELFRGRPYLLTPPERSAAVVEEFAGWLTAMGAVPRWISAEEHDRLVAAASHAPQLLSTALAAALAARADAEAVAGVAGPGLHDMTRLALSSYEIWRDILATNGDEISAALTEVEKSVAQSRREIGGQAMESQFEAAAHFATRLRNRPESR